MFSDKIIIINLPLNYSRKLTVLDGCWWCVVEAQSLSRGNIYLLTNQITKDLVRLHVPTVLSQNQHGSREK
jgi:hypothetical protein